jgi:lysophospholipase L1-like esterase
MARGWPARPSFSTRSEFTGTTVEVFAESSPCRSSLALYSAATVIRAVFLAAGVAVFSLVLGGSAAAGPVKQRPSDYYLALGDSLAYGVQPDKVDAGLPPSGFDTGFVDVFAARLRAFNRAIRVVNYGCPGESTVTFRAGGCPWLAEGRKLHDAFHGSQRTAAFAFLAAHRGRVSPITVTLGGNDMVAMLEGCKNLACVEARAPRALISFGARLTSILRQLRAAAPTAEIVVTGLWNFNIPELARTNALFRSLNTVIARSAAAAGAHFADVMPTFNPAGSVAKQRARLCTLTFICSRGDPHPKNAGYRAIAAAVLAASGYAR